MLIAIEVIFGLLSIAFNTSVQKLQEAYSRSDAFRSHFNELYNALNEEYQSKIRDATPTSSSSLNQRNYLQNLMYQRYGRDLNRLRTTFDEIQSKYDKKIYSGASAMAINRLTNDESKEKALAAEKLKQEGQSMDRASKKFNMYSRRPNSYDIMISKQERKGN